MKNESTFLEQEDKNEEVETIPSPESEDISYILEVEEC